MQKENLKNIIFGLFALLGVILIGITGFHLLEGYSFVDAFFMTIITISTVGFREVYPLSPDGKIFTIILIFFSFGIFAYVVTTFTRMLVDGVFRHYYKDNKMKRRVAKLSNHIILCGYGRNGRQVAVDLSDHEEEFVIIERDEGLIETIRENADLMYIHGDATLEEVLRMARVDRARALITTLPNDADNLFVVLTARQINPTMTIISRASHDNSDMKLKRAGATNVIMPDKIGGQRMAKLVTQPDVIEFMEYIILQKSRDVTLKEVSCAEMHSDYEGKSIGELNVRNNSGANIIGMKKTDKSYVFNPLPTQVLTNRDQLFVLGTPEQIHSLKEILKNPRQNTRFSGQGTGTRTRQQRKEF